MPFQVIYDAVTERLQYVAASVDNPRRLEDEDGAANTNPPLYVWNPVSIDAQSDEIGLSLGNQNPKAYGLDLHRWEVVCWGATRSDCEAMRLALVRAVRETLAGASYRVGSAEWGYPEWARNGYALAVDLGFLVPLVSVEIPNGAATDIPENDVTNDVQETVTITAVDPTDATDAVVGDGVLQGGEEP